MHKKNRRIQTKLENSKDRGDTRKDSSTGTGEINTYGLGDTTHNLIQKPTKTYNKEEKTKQPFITKKDDTNKLDVYERLSVPKKITDKYENQVRTYLDFEGRRRLRERYTVKLNKHPGLMKDEGKTEVKEIDKEEKKPEEQSEKLNKPVKSEAKIENTKNPPQRKPIIKTITAKNDDRVYKAVTFVDNNAHMPLQIKIPTNTRRKSTKSMETNTHFSNSNGKEPHLPIKEKPVRKDKFKCRKRISSPEMFRKTYSPPTEVAKWAPSCLKSHTKPYYEAWVDTTLAAFSKCTDEEAEKLIRIFQRPDDELFYENFKDERYIGKIKIRQKSTHKL